MKKRKNIVTILSLIVLSLPILGACDDIVYRDTSSVSRSGNDATQSNLPKRDVEKSNDYKRKEETAKNKVSDAVAYSNQEHLDEAITAVSYLTEEDQDIYLEDLEAVQNNIDLENIKKQEANAERKRIIIEKSLHVIIGAFVTIGLILVTLAIAGYRRKGYTRVKLNKKDDLSNLLVKIPEPKSEYRKRRSNSRFAKPNVDQVMDVWSKEKLNRLNPEGSLSLESSIHLLRNVILHVVYYKRYDDLVGYMLAEKENLSTIGALLNMVQNKQWEDYLKEDRVRNSEAVKKMVTTINRMTKDIIDKVNQLDNLKERQVENLRTVEKNKQDMEHNQKLQSFLDDIQSINSVNFDNYVDIDPKKED